MHIIGTSIGGASSKLAVMDERGEFCELFLLPSGFSAVKVARQIKQALEQKGYAGGFVTATDYGRVSVEYARLSMSEILCHGLGTHFLLEQDCTVIDVGGQDMKGDPVANIAERYLKIPCSVMYQNDARSDIIKEFIREYQADGVIDVVLSGCHTYAIETNRIKEASREAGANYMSLETDYSKQDVGQIRTRLEAFIELLG